MRESASFLPDHLRLTGQRCFQLITGMWCYRISPCPPLPLVTYSSDLFPLFVPLLPWLWIRDADRANTMIWSRAESFGIQNVWRYIRGKSGGRCGLYWSCVTICRSNNSATSYTSMWGIIPQPPLGWDWASTGSTTLGRKGNERKWRQKFPVWKADNMLSNLNFGHGRVNTYDFLKVLWNFESP